MTSNAASTSDLLGLYLRKRSDLLKFFAARTGSVAAGEDIVQEIYLKLQHAQTDTILNGAAYLYRLGINLMLDRYRSDASSRIRDSAYVQSQGATLGGFSVSDAPSAEDVVVARRQLERLLQAVETLPPQCKRAFRMHKLEGLSHGEVARALAISRSAVEKHMISALKHLASYRP